MTFPPRVFISVVSVLVWASVASVVVLAGKKEDAGDAGEMSDRGVEGRGGEGEMSCMDEDDSKARGAGVLSVDDFMS